MEDSFIKYFLTLSVNLESFEEMITVYKEIINKIETMYSNIKKRLKYNKVID